MPSKPKTQPSSLQQNKVFFPLVWFTLIIWLIYRMIFKFPIWFDETIGKAIFFGFPVWVYLSITRSNKIVAAMMPAKLYKGLLLGLAVGGLMGFAGSLLKIFSLGNGVKEAYLFAAPGFWWEFFLSLMTGFWESLFFFGWIMTVIMEKYKAKSLIFQVLLTATIFMIFHLPNTVLRFSPEMIIPQAFLMFLFGLGQALLFYRWKNIYALTVSHAIWGMVLLMHV